MFVISEFKDSIRLEASDLRKEDHLEILKTRIRQKYVATVCAHLLVCSCVVYVQCPHRSFCLVLSCLVLSCLVLSCLVFYRRKYRGYLTNMQLIYPLYNL
jgi:hypothetical protein